MVCGIDMKISILLIAIILSSCVQPWFPFSEKIKDAGLLYPEKEKEETSTVTINIEWPEE